MLCSSHLPTSSCAHKSTPTSATPMAMARSAPVLVAVSLLVLALVTLDAAQGQVLPVEPPPPPPPINGPDADALSVVFGRWGLEGAATVKDPCGKDAWNWSRPFAVNASAGCSCSSSECRITHLNVTGYRNITEIPLALFNLTELVSLDLSNNNLSGSIPAEIGNLSKLEIWHFNNNHLSGSFPNELSLLRNLQSLWMFDNYIDGYIPEFIQNLTNLTDLRLYGTKLQGPIPKSISSLINLENLILGDLEGSRSNFDFIGNWAKLLTLSLRNCGLIGQLPNLPNLPKLKYLDLRSNNLSDPIRLLAPYKNSFKDLNYIYVGENNFSGPLPAEIVEASVTLDVSYNPLINEALPHNPDGQKRPINYIGTSVDARGTFEGENLTILNCLRMKECNRISLTNRSSSFAINCGGEQLNYSDPLPTVFSEDSTDLGGAGFHVNAATHWVVSHVGSDPFNKSSGIVNTSDIVETDMRELYKTARTSTSALWYYVVGLANGKYTIQLFFAEIVIPDGPGRRLFDIDIQDQNIKKNYDIRKEAGGFRRPTSITHEVTVNNSILVIHLYWSGRGTCRIPYEGTYGPLVSAIKVTRSQDPMTSPPQPPRSDSSRQDAKRRGVVAGIAALCIAAAVVSSSVIYLWWKWVSLVKRPMA